MATRLKIGTALDAKVLGILKRRSRNTGKPVNRLIEEAVLAHREPRVPDEAELALRLRALKDFVENGPRLPRHVVDEILAEDPYDQ